MSCDGRPLTNDLQNRKLPRLPHRYKGAEKTIYNYVDENVEHMMQIVSTS